MASHLQKHLILLLTAGLCFSKASPAQKLEWIDKDLVEPLIIKPKSTARENFTFSGGLKNACQEFADPPLSIAPPARWPVLTHIGANLVDKGTKVHAQCQTEGYIESLYEIPKLRGECSETDLIFVIDNSGSMEALQDVFQKTISDFLKIAGSKGDIRGYVLTTDTYLGETPGSTFSNPLFGTAKIKKALEVGTGGSGDERPLLSLERALRNGGADVLRPKACAGIIILSDEDETLGAEDSVDLPAFINYLRSLKSDPEDKLRIAVFATDAGKVLRAFSRLIKAYFIDFKNAKPSAIAKAGRLFSEGDFMLALELDYLSYVYRGAQLLYANGQVQRKLDMPETEADQYVHDPLEALILQKPFAQGDLFRVQYFTRESRPVAELLDPMLMVRSLKGHREKNSDTSK